jgi:DNA-binding CsgD family transcriptional regulator
MEMLIVSTPHAAHHISRVALIRGTALVALERWDEAEAALRDAQAIASAQGRCGLIWRSGVALGRLLRARQRRDEAEAAFAAARGVIAQITQTVPDGALRETFTQQVAALLPERTRSPRRMEAERYGGLTAREREVARLVARGMSNRNIAGDLVLSERTVETHVTNILLKLGFTSRAQIAAWAAERGLTASNKDT